VVSLASIGKAVLAFSILYSIVAFILSLAFIANGFPPPPIFGNPPSISYFFSELWSKVSQYGTLPQGIMPQVVALTTISILLSTMFSCAGLLGGLVASVIAPLGLNPALAMIAYALGIFLDLTKFYYILQRASGQLGGPVV